MRARWWMLGAVAFALVPACKGRFKLAADARFVKSLAIGDQFLCARMKDGSVRCWGENGHGELGAGDQVPHPETTLVVGLGAKIEELAAGGKHACALSAAGDVWCWGANDAGEVASGAPGARAAAVKIDGLSAKHLAAGARHTCAITTSSDVLCWGANDAGQVPDEASRAALHGATAIAAEGDGTCAVLADRTVRCWGRIPGRGVIGVSRIEGLADVTGVALGESHVCAVKAWGGVSCWGTNGEGELGDGSFTTRQQPVDVLGLNAPARAVAVGRTHTCALLSEGTIRCWGGNTNSQLADGTHGHRASPALVQGLFEVQGLDVAGDATCARFVDGSARCWGGLRLPKTEGAHVPVPTEVRW